MASDTINATTYRFCYLTFLTFAQKRKCLVIYPMFLSLSQGEMAEISNILDTWINTELGDEDISKLKDSILSKIHNENRVELIPFHGFLQLKDKMWVGKVKRITPSDNLEKSLKSGTEPLEIYFVEVYHKIIEEIESCASEKLDWGVAVFAPSLSSADEDLTLQHLADYFVAVYSEIPKQTSQKRPQILGLGSKLQGILLSRANSSAKAAWSVKADVFTTALLNPLLMPTELADPHGYEIREMSLKETLYAADHWKYKTDSVTYRFATSCSYGMVFGAFPTGSSVPVSWTYASWDGAVSGVQTVDQHKKKGLAKAIVRKLSLKLIENGIIPCAYIEDHEGSNIPAALFSSLGYEIFKDIKFQWSFPCCRTCRK